MNYYEYLNSNIIENPFIKESYSSYLLSVFSDVISYVNYKINDIEKLQEFEKINTEKLETIAKSLEELIWEIENLES